MTNARQRKKKKKRKEKKRKEKGSDICAVCKKVIPMGTMFVSTGTGIAHGRCVE